jgi:NADH:ubiquinone oxidoreductase subunit K
MNSFINFFYDQEIINTIDVFLKKLIFLQCLPFYLFFCGLSGIILGRKNLILVVISLELLILAVAFHFLFISWGLFGDIKGIIFAIFSLCIGAAESALGLAFAISYLRAIKNEK